MSSRSLARLRRAALLVLLFGFPIGWVGDTPAALPPASRQGDADPAPGAPALRFGNRVAADARIDPSARGILATREATTGPARSLELTAGYTLAPGASRPRLAADLEQLGAATTAGTGRSGFIVHVADPDPASAEAAILEAGGTVVAPLAEGYWLVRMDAANGQRLAGSAGAPWVTPWEPAYKLSPRIERGAPGREDFTALLFTDGDGDATAKSLAGLGATRMRASKSARNNLLRFELDRSRAAEAAALPDIEWIEPSPRDSLLNDQAQWVVQTGVTNSRRMWDAGLTGQGQLVMSSDSGIRANHMLFDDVAHPITTFGHYVEHRKIVAYLAGADDPAIAFGDHGNAGYHGTHTAGTIAGNDEPNTPNPYDGIARDARLWLMDVGGPDVGGVHPPMDLNELFLPSYLGNAAGAARLSSNSWGASAQSAYTLSSMQVDQFMWDHPDYLIAFANGNNGFTGSVNSPATAKNCLSVGGTGNGSLKNKIYVSTSRGPTADLRRKPTVCAPGDLVISSVGNTRFAYASYSGTSMATPAATGGLAIVRQYLADGWYPTGAPVAANAMNPSAALMKAIAINAAQNDVLGFMAPDQNIGWGRLTLDEALFLPGDARRTLVIDATDGLLDREYVEYRIRVADPGQPFKVSLCWTDYPGNPAVISQIVNDLDLVVSNGAVTYLGNRFANGNSRTGGPRDSMNVEEGVRVAAPTAGVWTVRVEGHRVARGPQPFALCVTGAIAGDGGAVALDRFTYLLDDTLEVEVLDTDATGPLSVTVGAASEFFPETLLLAGGNGVFRAKLPMAPVAYGPHDGVLSVSSGDVITVTYHDATSGTDLTTTARVNVDAPVITDVHARALDATSALITWKTDISSSSRVHVGEAPSVGTVVEVEGEGLVVDHRVLLTGLELDRTYAYDVESVAHSGSASRDDLGGAHRTFTLKPSGQLALVLGNTGAALLDTWTNAFNVLGWDVDILAGPPADPPLVGQGGAGLARHAGVMWQVDPDVYPPFSAAQRAAIDSLLDGGGRLFVTGHDIGYALCDAGSPVYSPETEAWVEQGLKTRYYADALSFNTLSGVAGDPITGAWPAGIPYYSLGYGLAGDVMAPAPGTDGVGSIIWRDNQDPPQPSGIRWESNAPRGSAGAGTWGGHTSRLVGMYHEWSRIGSANSAHEARRTGVLETAMAWLLEHRPPHVAITSPAGGEVVTADLLPIRFTVTPDAGRSIAERSFWYSLDGGETWNSLGMIAATDTSAVWDLSGTHGGATNGPAVNNATRVLVRMAVTDEGAVPLRGVDVSDAVFTIARPNGDTKGPVVVAGSVRATPMPVRRGVAATLTALFSDAETGGGTVTAAEFGLGDLPTAPGTGMPMEVDAPGGPAAVAADIPTLSLPIGDSKLWLRARDNAGNWGPATRLSVSAHGDGVSAVGDALRFRDFLAPPTPNPFRGSAVVRFGLSREGNVTLDIFDISGRRVRRLAGGILDAGDHESSWDGRNDQGDLVNSGVYFVRVATPAGAHRSRIVFLR